MDVEGTTYPVVVHQDRPDGPYGVSVPDLPGCVTAADTLPAALARAAEAITLWIEVSIDTGRPVPPPSNCIDPDGGRVALVTAPTFDAAPAGAGR